MSNYNQNPLMTMNSGANRQNDPLNPIQALMIAQILSQGINPGFARNAQLQTQNSSGSNTHQGCILNLDEHLKYADALMSAGIIDKKTGESMKNQMTANFQTASKASAPQMGGNQSVSAVSNPQKAFDISQSSFLKTRECLLNYLKNLDIELDEEDLRAIEEVVLELEKAAISRQTKESGTNSAEDALKILNQSNEIAKSRLMTDSLRGSSLKQTPDKTFTRDEIAKMSTAEFIKNEPVINYQLQNGLL